MNDRLGGTTSLDGGNIRYYGASPNNYVYFNCEEYPSTNCELWRIIGLFDGKVKLIRNEAIGNYSYDNKPTASGDPSEVESSDWRYARLMKLLNPSYESESIGGSLYYNSKSGACYSGQNNQTIACDFTSTGVKESAKEYISKELWYLGRHSYSTNSDGSSEFYPNYINELYQNEINDSNITWEGYVSLINASDYVYARDLNICLGTITTGNNNTDCLNNNYLQRGMQSSFLLNRYDNYSITLTHINGGIIVGSNIDGRVYKDKYVFPSLYLKENILLSSGDGSIESPFNIVMY